jgi:hypothetical protein
MRSRSIVVAPLVGARGGSGVEWGGDPCGRPRPLPTPFLEKTSL